jgi:ABC-type phosphate transport system substrate-binding protein
MKTFSLKFRAATAALFLFGMMAVNAQDKSTELAIIVGKSSALDDVTTAQLQKYFKAEKTKAPDGTKIAIVMQDVGNPERDAALHDIYKMSEAEYNDYFVGQTFTGAVAAAPKALPSSAAVKQYVAATAGALGYVRASDADDSVKVLKVDGKSPGDAGYSLSMK